MGDNKSSDGDMRAGQPPEIRDRQDLPPLEQRDIRMGPPTAVGCLLVVVCVLIIFGVAIPVVRWRDPDSGQALPRMIAVFIPVVAGAVCYAICAGICKLFGVRLYKERSETSDEDANQPPTR